VRVQVGLRRANRGSDGGHVFGGGRPAGADARPRACSLEGWCSCPPCKIEARGTLSRAAAGPPCIIEAFSRLTGGSAGRYAGRGTHLRAVSTFYCTGKPPRRREKAKAR